MTRTIVLLPIAAAGLIIAGVVIALWMAGSASGERDKFSSLEIAPAEADIFFALNTDPTSPQWLAVNDSLGDINAKDPIREAIDAALAEVNLDWEEDILPAAGDEAFLSIPDIERFTEGDESTGGGVVAGFRIRNQDKAQEVFDDLRARAADEGDDFQEEEYEGVTIYYTEAPEIDIDEPIGSDDEDEDADDEPPILDPFDDTFFECLQYSFDFEEGEDAIPTECQPYFECPLFGLNLGADDTDSDGDGIPDTCEEFDFFGDDAPQFEIFPDDEAEFELISGDEEESIGAPDFETAAVALFDNVLALGASPDDVKSVIDVVQGRADSAETNERLQEFRALQDDDFLMWGYADLAPVWGIAEETIDSWGTGSLDDGFEEDPVPFDTEEIFEELRGTYDRVGFSVSSMDAGFAFDLTVLHAEGFDPEFRFEPTRAFTSEFAERVPAETMLFLAGYDVYNQSWVPAREQLEELDFGDGTSFDELLDDLADETGIDFESELLAQLTGEYAIAADFSDFEDPEFSILALLDLEDANTAERALQELGDYLEDQEAISAEESDGINRWTAPDDGDIGLTWTIADGDFLGGYPDSAVEDAEAGVDDSLADNADWRRTLELLPGDKTFIGFVSIARILDEARNLPDAEAEFLASTNGEVSLDDLEPIRSIGFSGTARDNGFGFHAVLFMED